jgi:hypothetical protein
MRFEAAPVASPFVHPTGPYWRYGLVPPVPLAASAQWPVVRAVLSILGRNLLRMATKPLIIDLERACGTCLPAFCALLLIG